MTTAEKEIASFFAKYDAPIAKLGKALRSKLQARLPGLNEIVYLYENQGSLLFTYTATSHGHEGVCGLAVYPDRVNVYFGKGAELSKSDPTKLLQGSGKTVRHVVIGSASDLDRADIEALMAAALRLSDVRIDPKAKGSIVIKAEEQKARARSAAKAKRPAAKKGTTKTKR